MECPCTAVFQASLHSPNSLQVSFPHNRSSSCHRSMPNSNHYSMPNNNNNSRLYNNSFQAASQCHNSSLPNNNRLQDSLSRFSNNNLFSSTSQCSTSQANNNNNSNSSSNNSQQDNNSPHISNDLELQLKSKTTNVDASTQRYCTTNNDYA